MLRYYNIAGLTVAMDSFGRTEQQAKAYLCEPCHTPDIVITSYREIMQERAPSLSLDDAEYLGTGAGFYKELLRFDGFRLHASAVVVDGKAYLFSAESGTGKSTHTAMWLKQFGPRAFLLNDDKPALRRIDGNWYAFGTPWSGKNDISVNTGVLLGGIAMLERGETNTIQPFTGKDAIFEIFVQTNRPKAAQYRVKLLELMDSLMQQVPVWKLKCNMEPEAAIVAYEAMSGRKFEGI